MLGQVEHDVAHMFHHHTRSLTTDRLTLANRNYDLGEFYLTLTEGLNLENRNLYTLKSFLLIGYLISFTLLVGQSTNQDNSKILKR